MEAVIFIGIQATGKSTFYRERFFDTHVRVNLDMLKTRHREELLLQACIRSQQPFVVDNTNVLVEERARYIALAKPAGYSIVGFFFQSPLKDALRRNQQRQGKAIVPTVGVIAKYRRTEPPRYEEGFDRLFSVSIDEHNLFVVQDWVQEDSSKNSTI